MLSIIIITKNEEKALPRLINSIKRQDYKKEYEIIVSDAYSKDNTRNIAKKYNCKIVDGGMPAIGRNNGAKVAKGDLLLFLDADSELPQHFLSKNINEFKRRKLDVGGFFVKPISFKVIDKFMFFFANGYSFSLQFLDPHAGGISIMVKKSLFQKVNGFNEDLVLCEDHDFVKRCSHIGKFRLLQSVPILEDIRRLEYEGRLKLGVKYLYFEFYRLFHRKITKAPLPYNLDYEK